VDDLIAFLRARLDEAANEGKPDQHTRECGYDQIGEGFDCDCGVPATALADVAAKREIINQAGYANVRVLAPDHCEASLIAAQMAAIYGMPTAVYDRI